MSEIISLTNIINIAAIEKIQEDIAKATGIAIITVDYKGKPITKHSCCTEFCELIRENKELTQLCEKCDSRGGIEATRTGKPYIYICHLGIVDFSIPIIVRGQYLGAFMGGQILTKEKDYLKLEKVLYVKEENKKDKKILDAYKKLKVMPLKDIKNISDMIFDIAKYIVDNSLNKIEKEKISNITDEIKNMKTHELRLQREVEKARLQSLTPKISSQFLFNILNSIYLSAVIEKADKTSEIAFGFCEMLKKNFGNSNKNLSIEEEIEYIKQYLNLQKIRLGKRLNFDISLNEKDKTVIIPFMSIFPFVENALIHGISSKKDGGLIKISIKRENKCINIEIIDDGIGIREDELRLINEKIENIKYIENGINNAKIRIINFFKFPCSLKIESEINEGTIVRMKLPIDHSYEEKYV